MKTLYKTLYKIFTWTPSRLAKWRECPAKVRYEDVLKLCPACFRGRVSGGYDGEPVRCDTCSKPQPERPALDRGNRLDAVLTTHLSGPKTLKQAVDGEDDFKEATRHPEILKLVKKLKRTKGVSAQESIVLDSTWKRVGQFTKNAWARVKLDVLVLGAKARIIDWKSGNINNKTGEIRERPEYKDSMLAYQISVLSAYPMVKEVTAEMAFLDAPSELPSPFKSLPVLKRADLARAQRAWEAKVTPMLSDTVLAPRPGYYCDWCPFSKRKGGPCPH